MKELPSMEHTFSVKVEGKNGGQTYEGAFTYRRPSIGIKSKIGKLEAKLNEDIKYLPEDILDLHFAIAWLYYTIIDAPDWWKKSDSGMDLYDFDVVYAIHGECMKFEKDWKDRVWGNQEQAQKDGEAEVKAKKKKAVQE